MAIVRRESQCGLPACVSPGLREDSSARTAAGARREPNEESVAEETAADEDRTARCSIDQPPTASATPRQRDLVALRYGADLAARQIGQILGLKTNTVEGRPPPDADAAPRRPG